MTKENHQKHGENINDLLPLCDIFCEIGQSCRFCRITIGPRAAVRKPGMFLCPQRRHHHVNDIPHACTWSLLNHLSTDSPNVRCHLDCTCIRTHHSPSSRARFSCTDPAILQQRGWGMFSFPHDVLMCIPKHSTAQVHVPVVRTITGAHSCCFGTRWCFTRSWSDVLRMPELRRLHSSVWTPCWLMTVLQEKRIPIVEMTALPPMKGALQAMLQRWTTSFREWCTTRAWTSMAQPLFLPMMLLASGHGRKPWFSTVDNKQGSCSRAPWRGWTSHGLLPMCLLIGGEWQSLFQFPLFGGSPPQHWLFGNCQHDKAAVAKLTVWWRSGTAVPGCVITLQHYSYGLWCCCCCLESKTSWQYLCVCAFLYQSFDACSNKENTLTHKTVANQKWKTTKQPTLNILLPTYCHSSWPAYPELWT